MRDLCQIAFQKFLRLEQCEPYEVVNARTYYDKYATDEEKRTFEKAFEKYRKKFTIRFEDRAREAFNIYLRYGLDNERFQQLAQKYEIALPVAISYPAKYAEKYATPEEKAEYQALADKQAAALAEEEKAKQKYIWEYCDNVEWHPQKIIALADKLKISLPYLKKLAFAYAIAELKLTEPQIKKRIQEKSFIINQSLPKEKKYEMIFNKLTNLENEAEIVDFLTTCKASVYYLRSKLDNYLNQLDPKLEEPKRQELAAKLLAKINLYAQKIASNLQSVLKDKKAEAVKPLIPEAIKIVEKFLLDEAPTKEQFCWDNNINIDLFEKYLSIIEQYDSNLYKVYITKINNQNIKNQASIMGKLGKVIAGLTNGILINDEQTRPFDLIDYYLITSMPLDTFYGICAEHLNANELKLVKKFFRKYRDDSYLTPPEIQKIMMDRDEVTTTKDENGFPIAGTGRIISEKEKQAIIDYLRRNKIVVTNCTYNIAFRRYILGTLEIEDQNLTPSTHGK
ncbi:MAG TPA: hypothetical protein PK737_00810 [Bacilli bacterium]|nr:hypothetical protein [Bacilli bacterium]